MFIITYDCAPTGGGYARGEHRVTWQRFNSETNENEPYLFETREAAEAELTTEKWQLDGGGWDAKIEEFVPAVVETTTIELPLETPVTETVEEAVPCFS